VRQIGLADSELARLGHAIRWIRVHYDQTLRVEELATLATMSVSSFHRHFRTVTSMAPIQFQKQIRLHEHGYGLSPSRGTSQALASTWATTALAVQPRVPSNVRRATEQRRTRAARERRAADS